MKKIILLFIIVFSFQSCFRIHKARRIEAYEIIEPKHEGSLSNYAFEFTGNKDTFEAKTKSFFSIKEDYLPFSFTTKELYSKEELTVYIYFSSDKDKHIDLFSGFFFQALGLKEDKKRDDIVKKQVYKYINIQVTDKDGKDVLAENSLRQKSVIEKLTKYNRIIN